MARFAGDRDMSAREGELSCAVLFHLERRWKEPMAIVACKTAGFSERVAFELTSVGVGVTSGTAIRVAAWKALLEGERLCAVARPA